MVRRYYRLLRIKIARIKPRKTERLQMKDREFVQSMRQCFRKYRRTGHVQFVSFIELYEIKTLAAQYSELKLKEFEQSINEQIAILINIDSLAHEKIGYQANGCFSLMLPLRSKKKAHTRLRKLSRRIVNHDFKFEDQSFHFTPVIGYLSFTEANNLVELEDKLRIVTDYAESHLDLMPIGWRKEFDIVEGNRISLRKRIAAALRTPFQIFLTLFIGLIGPYYAYHALYALGIDITFEVYLSIVAILILTSTLVLTEAILSIRAPNIPSHRGSYPKATAIIAAYLPNEAETIMQTLNAFFNQNYANELQIILAYNTPHSMPIEAEFKELQKVHKNFYPLRVRGSTSKAQNVNAAVSHATGVFVGVFDADHEPDVGSFERAWQWLQEDYDIVQGHCLIRNAEESWVARMVAIEFETIYSVSHLGRTRLHGFGLFGGSNGYWRTLVLRRTRMHHFMLTEDIDSSIRSVYSGYRIAYDRNLISRELAPTEWRQLMNQRLRWAQGWFQVSMKWFIPAMYARNLTYRQRLGLLHLLAWRELFPWYSIQIVPIMMFWISTQGLENIDWFVPIFFATTIYTLFTGPIIITFAQFLAHESIAKHRSWFIWYQFMAIPYTAFKNTLSRWAHVKEFTRERVWRVTPRTTAPRIDKVVKHDGDLDLNE